MQKLIDFGAYLTLTICMATPYSKNRPNAVEEAALDVDTPAPLIAPHRPHSSPGSIGRLTQPESNEPASAVCAASRRPQLAPSEKVAVLNWYHANGRNQKATAAHFRALSRYAKLNQGTISRWLAAEAKIREAQSKSMASDAVHNCRRNAATREKSLKHPELEKCLASWLEQLDATQRSRLSGKEVKSTARQIYDKLGVPESDRLELSNGWLSRFQTRHGLKLRRRHSDGLVSSAEVDVEAERGSIRDDITVFLAGNNTGNGDAEVSRSLDDVWSVGMTTIYLECSPIKGVDGTSKSRKRTEISVGLVVNAAGTEHLEPFFIEQDDDSGDEQALTSKDYASTRAECKALSIFQAWLQSRNQLLVDANRHVLLLVPKSREIMIEEATVFSNICLRLVPPAVASHHVQPGSIGLTRIFQTKYRELLVNRAVHKLHNDGIIQAAELFELGTTDTIGLATTAWQLVGLNLKLVVSCWQKARILPTQAGSTFIEADACISIAISEELAKLEEAIQVLSLEAESCGVPITCVSAGKFACLGLDKAQGTYLCVAELAHPVVPQQQVKHITTTVDSPPSAQQDMGSTECCSSPNEENSSTDADLRGIISPVQQELSISPEVVLHAQTTLERYWAQNNVTLSPAVLEVLQQTQAKLMQHHASTS